MNKNFEFNIYGNKKELIIALKEIKAKARKSKNIKTLIKYNKGIDENLKNDNYVLSFNSNINLLFNYEDVMYDLCKMFMNLEIEAKFYSESNICLKLYKKIGEIEYEKSYDPYYISIHMKDYDLALNKFIIYIDFLDTYLYVDGDLFKDQNEKLEEKSIIYNLNEYSFEIDLSA